MGRIQRSERRFKEDTEIRETKRFNNNKKELNKLRIIRDK